MLLSCVAPVDTIKTTSITAVKDDFRFAFFRSIDAAGSDWDAAAPAHNIFLQRPFLNVLEKNPPDGMRFGYLVFYKGNLPVGVAIGQIKYFKADQNIQSLEVVKEPCFFDALASWFKRSVSGWVAGDILICGNMLLTGSHGFYFDETQITRPQAAILLETSLVEVLQIMERSGVKMPVILMKDLMPADRPVHGQYLQETGFVEFEIQPNMVLDLSRFGDFNEYLEHMSTKYRTRAKRAFKKGTTIERREMTLADVLRESDRMYQLYRDVAKAAGFNMVDLNPGYLAALKRDLSDHFRVFAYYLDGQLVAFYTTLCNGEEMEAHFLGYDKHQNHEHQIYLNILYDIIRHGFDNGHHKLVFARTALEIKSSVGAEPEALWCYLRHQNSLINHFTGTVLDYFKPIEEWVQRHPFKESE
jgi:Acetyltransferase (GNAT) domain